MPRGKQELMKPKPPVEFTEERKAIFLEHLRNTGFQTLSAEAAGVTTRCIQDHKTRDKVFADQYQQALDFHTENVITKALIQRGVNGVKKPIIGGKDRDEIVTHVTEYSDACLLALARSRKVEFNKGAGADDASGGSGGSGGGLLLIPIAPHTIGEWEKIFGEKAKGNTGKPGYENKS